MSIIEDRGYFWLSEEAIPKGHFAPGSAVSGSLIISDDGRVELELDAFLTKAGKRLPLPESDDSEASPKIHIQGVLKKSGKFVQIFDARSHGEHFRSNGISHQQFVALFCLVGDLPVPQSAATPAFSELQFDLKGYEDWLRIGSISYRRTKTRIYLTHKIPDIETYEVADGSLSILFDVYAPRRGARRLHSVSVNESVSLNFKSKIPNSLHEAANIHGLVQDLLILLTNSSYLLDWPTVTFASPKKRQTAKKCKLYFGRISNSATPPRWHESLTSFPMIRDKFGDIFQNWSSKRDIFGPAFCLYLGTRRGVTLYTEHRFVNLVWGIESFHRRKYGSAPPDSNLSIKIARILEQISLNKDRKWLEKKLGHANEPSLEERLFEVFGALELKFDAKKLRAFCKKCAQYRNDTSHFGGVREAGDYRQWASDISKHSNVLSLFYNILLLQEIGIEAQILTVQIEEGPMAGHYKKIFEEVALEIDDTARSAPDESS